MCVCVRACVCVCGVYRFSLRLEGRREGGREGGEEGGREGGREESILEENLEGIGGFRSVSGGGLPPHPPLPPLLIEIWRVKGGRNTFSMM